MINILKKYHIIKECDLNKLFNIINDLKQDVINLTNENKELKTLIINSSKQGQQDFNNMCLPGNDANEININVGHDAPDKSDIIQDTIIKDYNLSVINEKPNTHNKQRYYYKSHYLFYADAKYYKLLNLRFNELMKEYNKDIDKVKKHLKLYLIELETKDI